MHFQSTWVDSEGAQHRGVHEARDVQALHERLAEEGCILLDAAEQERRTARPTQHRLAERKRLAFVEAMETSLGAGVTVLATLESLAEAEESERDREIYADLILQLEAGSTLAEATAGHSRSFGEIAPALIRAGEQSGQLDAVFGTLARYWQWQRDLRSTARQAMAYPAVILAAAYGLVLFLLSYVVPTLGGVIRKLGDDLPAHSRILFEASGWVAGNLGLVLGGTAAGLATVILAARSDLGRSVLMSIGGQLPLAHAVIHTLDLARLCRTLAAMLQSGLTLVEALTLAEPVLVQSRLKFAVQRVHASLLDGDRFSQAVTETQMLPTIAVGMLRVAENAGDLPRCLERLADSYDKQARAAVQRAIAVLEPAATILLGVIVGGVAAVILSTLYTAIGGLAK